MLYKDYISPSKLCLERAHKMLCYDPYTNWKYNMNSTMQEKMYQNQDTKMLTLGFRIIGDFDSSAFL